MSLFCSISNI